MTPPTPHRTGNANPAPVPSGAKSPAGPELLDDGQEEVFAKTAVERGLVRDPKALAPEALARSPKSNVDLRRP